MCLGYIGGAMSFEIMTIHEYGYRLPLPRSRGGVCPIEFWAIDRSSFGLCVPAFLQKLRPGG